MSLIALASCLSSCGRTGLEGAAPVSAACGNGLIETNEHCDDGNEAAGDGCVPYCHIYLFVGGEQCDDGNTVPEDGCDDRYLLEHGPCYVDEDLGVLTPGVRVGRRIDMTVETDEWVTDCTTGPEYALMFETLETLDLNVEFYQIGHHTIGLYTCTT